MAKRTGKGLRAGWRLQPDEVDPANYPSLRAMSLVDIYSFQPVPREEPGPPEIVLVKPPSERGRGFTTFVGCVADWNGLWESGHLRTELLRGEAADWPPNLTQVMKRAIARQSNVQFAVGDFGACMPLYHLLSMKALQASGLPPLKAPLWPNFPWGMRVNQTLPLDFRDRVAVAFAGHVWRFLSPRALQKHLGADHSVRLLAHNLEYWLPYVELVIQRRAKALGRFDYDEDDVEDQRRRHRQLREKYRDAPFTPERPLRWGELWAGEEEAWEVTKEVVDVADEKGSLRAILDAFHSNRVEEDFSDLWSWEREDFERKLYAKRHRMKVSFVQIDEATPVHSPAGEVHENLLWSDLFALLDRRERRVLVCLRNGETRLGDIAQHLGYTNHSPVSKALARIRSQLKALLN